ncbi:hypothetical protein AEAC466_17170 [Asticcacaulis sp. AC466]|uniref:aldose epimerase family protein n=1 Tax=Asticcacaulis sp. AC466 TaxID=1282362 RepID=UPI0003C3CE5D|nr:aldose epimerase family protein [Asticcacaulis sp. AC466]ESQ82598.1 hypothetical protein AEAC466_17170 [Asticcacaulis sp. AC466]
MKALLILALAVAGAQPVQSQRMPYGVTADGQAVERITLRNSRGTTLGILTYGGIIDEIRVRDRTGKFDSVVLALSDLAAYEARPNFGSIVGRFANRISGGFALDGQHHALSPDGSVVSHGGKPGFGARVWKADPCKQPMCRSVTLSYTSPDGENGFPGAMKVSVTYSLGNDDSVRIDYRATTTRATVINLTNHSYFNLAGRDAGRVDGQTLRVAADAYLPLTDKKVPTGEIRKVDGTPFDLRRPVAIGSRVTAEDPQIALMKGFDHNWVLSKPEGELAPVAWLSDPVSGRTLTVLTTEPGLQVYTANGFNGTLKSASGRMLAARDGIALETQHFPDSPNQPAFPTTVLRPGQVFTSTTIYRFGITSAP